MPELPDIAIYVEALRGRLIGRRLERVRLRSPFLLRSVDPPLDAVSDREVREVLRLGKRIAFGLDPDLFVVLHLMVAGRIHWRKPGAGLPGRIGLAAFDFSEGSLVLTESGTKKRASLHVVRGRDSLQAHHRGGLEVLTSDLKTFGKALVSESHTLKRALTDPRLFSGIGNAYSDEILHRAQLSPFKLTGKLTAPEVERLHTATRETMETWILRLREETGDDFPEKVTAFRPEMAVHGRYRKPCPVCGSPVQRIVYAENEANYCATCQTGGKLLADRALSRLLKKDWPKTLEELEGRL